MHSFSESEQLICPRMYRKKRVDRIKVVGIQASRRREFRRSRIERLLNFVLRTSLGRMLSTWREYAAMIAAPMCVVQLSVTYLW